jgi:hypothetical protein
MPRKHWTRHEKRSLRKQIAAGISPHEIIIENRTWAAIRYILRALNIRWSNRWTRSQTKSLIVQAKQAKKLPDLRIDNKSLAAINAKRRYLRIAGKLRNDPGCPKRKYSGADLSY